MATTENCPQRQSYIQATLLPANAHVAKSKSVREAQKRRGRDTGD